ncbi:PLC-like phosphodiesterase [Multifurca ochricompacta]|uniref:PLC-like phosphodiesterase n=1 Tax=Multifurca ochricompacta TaxID=376703 RepID=A0AAD4QPN8_9AGAM|nr:PLC-like phosphodiesterase [Multifurca ochricompacta]
MSSSKNDSRVLPECWGHRGASAAYPENTLASFEAAIRDGAEGIESDVHVSRDGVLVMFHDPSLERTTDSKGLIQERNWYGPGGMEHVRTSKEPKQAIPTFAETIGLLMKPENQHVKFNIDVKVNNDPEQVFTSMDKIITSHPEWKVRLAPRIILGLWHPRFVSAAKVHLPYCKRSHIGVGPDIARKYFWDDCDAFSMWFPGLATADGEKFRRECKKAGKQLMVWTVNDPSQMMEAVRWGVDAILTDVTKTWLDLRVALNGDYDKVGARYTRSFLWTGPLYYAAVQYGLVLLLKRKMEKIAGSFDNVEEEINTRATMVHVRV